MFSPLPADPFSQAGELVCGCSPGSGPADRPLFCIVTHGIEVTQLPLLTLTLTPAPKGDGSALSDMELVRAISHPFSP